MLPIKLWQNVFLLIDFFHLLEKLFQRFSGSRRVPYLIEKLKETERYTELSFSVTANRYQNCVAAQRNLRGRSVFLV